MKIRSIILNLIYAILLFAGTAAFGQVTLTWIGPSNGALDEATNWDLGQVPNPDDPTSGTAGAGDIITFNGNTPGPLSLFVLGGGLTGGSGSTIGLYVHLTGNQTSPVQFISPSGLGQAFRLQIITNDAGSGGLILGDNGTGNTFNTIWGGVNGQIQELLNNSASPCVINSGVQIRMGGGGAHNFTFDGTGNWYVTNDMNNANGSVSLVTKNGTGTMVWYSTNNPNLANNGNFGTGNGVFIGGGTLILKTSDSFRSVNIGARGIVHNGVLLEYDDVNPAGGGTLSGVISGTGALQVNSGTLTLAAQSTYTGSNILTGGELIAGAPETAGVSGPFGQTGIISFDGGILGYNANNANDYSSRFDTAANQQYKIDTGGQFVFYTTPLASSGGFLNKIGGGVLTLIGASSYSGATTVSGGKLVFQGAMSGTGNITVTDGSALGVFNNGTVVSPGTLTLGSSAGTVLEFNALSSTTTAPLNAGTLVSAGTQVMNINSGTFTVGDSYPLLSWTSGSAPAVQLGLLNGYIGDLSTNGNSIQLNIVATAFSWTGAADGFWNLTSVDWKQDGNPVMVTNNAPIIFDDTSSVTNVTLAITASPTVATFLNVTNNYTLVSSGTNNLGGSANLFLAGTGIVTMSGGANTYTGVTTLGGGTLQVTNLAIGGAISDIGAASSTASNIVFNGGVLQYFGPGATIDRLFTLNSFGGTIDNEGTGTLNITSAFTNGMAGGGGRTLTLNGVNTLGDILGSVLPDGSGATAVVKEGAGTWIFTGNNTYSGLTTINNGFLQVGNGGGSGSLGNSAVLDNTGLVFDRTGTVTVVGPINGPGVVTNNGTGTVILANDSGFTGGLVINSGTVQLGNGGPTGSLDSSGAMIDDGTLVFDSSGSFFYSGGGGTGLISGTGNVIVAAGAARPIAANTYTGWTQINAGATFQPCQGQTGQLLSSVVTNNGTLQFQRQDTGVFSYAGPIYGSGRVLQDNNNQNPGNVTLLGTNAYTGGTWIAGGFMILGDNSTAGAGALYPTNTSPVIFTNAAVNDGNPRGLIINRPDSFTFTNHILGKTVISGGTGNPGTVYLTGGATVTLIGTNTYQGGTTVSNGALVVGNGGTTGAIGSGPVDDETAITFNRAGTLQVPGNFGGPGTVAMVGSGLVNLSGFHGNLTGSTAVSNGILGLANSIGGEVDVAGGTLTVGGYSTSGTPVQAVGTLSIGNADVIPGGANLNISAGTVSMALNTALAQSNSFVQMAVTNVTTTTTFTTNGSVITTNTVSTTNTATGAINYTGGTLQLVNAGPTLQVGQRFVLFSAPVAIPTIVSPGFTVANNLATDGSVTVTAVAVPPAPSFLKKPKLVNGTNLVISATNNFGFGGNWDLVATNNINTPVANWPVVQSGNFDANGSVTFTNVVSTNRLFFDLRAP